jgi:hypothetical protein
VVDGRVSFWRLDGWMNKWMGAKAVLRQLKVKEKLPKGFKSLLILLFKVEWF